MDLVYYGTRADVEAVRDAMDVAMGVPVAPTNGPFVVSPAVEAQMRATWWALTKAQRDSLAFDHLWPGWTLRWSNMYQETAPGDRLFCWVHDWIDTMLADARAAGRPLTLAQQVALIAAKAAATTTLPANWVEEP